SPRLVQTRFPRPRLQDRPHPDRPAGGTRLQTSLRPARQRPRRPAPGTVVRAVANRGRAPLQPLPPATPRAVGPGRTGSPDELRGGPALGQASGVYHRRRVGLRLSLPHLAAASVPLPGAGGRGAVRPSGPPRRGGTALASPGRAVAANPGLR